MESGLNRRYLIIVNPVSRCGKAQKEGIWLINKFRKLGANYEALFTEKEGHAEEIVTKWADAFDVVVAVSGDGTINEIINGIMRVPRGDMKLAVFPSGTADDFATNIGYKRTDRRMALRAIFGNNHRTIDLIKHGNKYAAVTFGVGVDAEVAGRSYRLGRVKTLMYIINGVKIAFFEESKKYPVRCTYDGQVFEDEVKIALICNAPKFGRFVKIYPGSKMNDGKLGLFLAHEMPNLYALYLVGIACASARHTFSHKLEMHEAKEICLELLEDTYVQIDGEVFFYEKGSIIELSVVPRALRVLVPEESLDDEKLPFIEVSEKQEIVQPTLFSTTDEISRELKEVSERIKKRAESYLLRKPWNK